MIDPKLSRELINKYGLWDQLKKLSEECAEYIQAQIKYDLNNSTTSKGLQGIIDEIADIEIVISSLRYCLGIEIDKAITDKSHKAQSYIDKKRRENASD